MAQPYVGEIRMFAGNFAPFGWMFCAGQSLAIAENDVLFTLIGTTYGGDGQTTFNLPDLQGRVPIHMGLNPATGTSYVIGQNGGVEQVTLITQQLPVHSHPFTASTSIADQNGPANNVVAQPSVARLYFANNPTQALNAASLGQAGGSQPHENMQPYLCVSFIISLFGIFPPPS